jgi:hypothetical protein
MAMVMEMEMVLVDEVKHLLRLLQQHLVMLEVEEVKIRLMMEHLLVLIQLLMVMVNDHLMMDNVEIYVVVVELLEGNIVQVNELIQNGGIGVINIDLLHRMTALLN